ncbi:OPT family oligopeptide transporter [Methylobacterium sp. J-076]|uniref:OPT family oligopeptide transporter n=1 Tax=Methylobacterium sp. J-076 TaxID=2836655 RepID=UPI001FBA846F|nr:oligopeptide transporter, OPT family [Methylobacterium sp. J-076]MCJ2013926.1 oligopeptide transporter, OPT family [Methylobacterium sp. J-076]
MDARNEIAATAGRHGREITARGLVLGAAITVAFMAANIYMGLKTGMTFSSSIPAALLSMGALRLVGGGILENNIVQTQASAAGTLCNVILVLPGLVLIGYWHGFPFWETSLVCLVGGWLGVAFSIPLRRALVTGSALPYPEGIAAAEVLRAGHTEEGRGGLTTLLAAAAGSGLVAFLTNGVRLLADGVLTAFAVGGAAFSVGSGFSLALIGVGYLVGIGACLALLTGVAIAWGILVPLLTALGPPAGVSPGEAAQAVWAGQVRLVGAGIIAVGGFWTVAALARPILASIGQAAAAARRPARDLPRHERDLPILWVGVGALALAVPLAALFQTFGLSAGLSGSTAAWVTAACVLFCYVFGAAMAAVCGYLAGLLGSSTSPISGIGILAAMVGAVAVPLVVGVAAPPDTQRFAMAAVLLAASVVVTASSIANDNLQDLKTGQLVDATPWRQQAVLLLGVAVGSLVIVPLLSLLYGAYGFVGALPRPGMDPREALAVPQAALVTQITDGIVHGTLPWPMLLLGGVLGLGAVGLERVLKRRGVSFPALTVGIGMYLPLSVEMTIGLGGLLGFVCERALRRRDPGGLVQSRRRGILIASGLLVGESFVGVGLAAVDAAGGRTGSLSLAGTVSDGTALWLGLGVFGLALGIIAAALMRPAPPLTRGN